ncbi:MAG: hypothetical protein LBR56_03400 [Sporomusaceae bacterium]|jgi:proteic killer suppression protein|nr:hypothetical protein [Sporomusaceae bacterium]
MQVRYKNKKLEKLCTDLKEAKKKYSGEIPEKLLSVINFINSASNLTDLINYPPFHFHPLAGTRCGQYAIDIGGRRSGYRLIFMPINNDGTTCTNEQIYSASAVNVIIIQAEEVTNHYE